MFLLVISEIFSLVKHIDLSIFIFFLLQKLTKSLIPRHLNVQMWKYLLESYASEQAARMIAMENATDNAEDMIKNLTLEFNKARQASITKEMLEIVGGAEALK